MKMKMKMTKKTEKIFMNMPLPSNISFMWNIGSMLGITMTMQILTGIMVSMMYNSNMKNSFKSYMEMEKLSHWSYFMKYFHSNAVSMVFIMIYFHMWRSMLNNSFANKKTWNTGWTMLMLLMATAFLGYVLPWGQMSFWGATVITNLLSTIPITGKKMVNWMWGGFSVDQPTLSRFFSIHFMTPMLIILMIMIHMNFLHKTSSSNQLSTSSNKDKTPLNFKFSSKDTMWILFPMIMLMYIISNTPQYFMEPDNYMMANPMKTPSHITPEWYFLFAYSILRSTPNKLGGVMLMLTSILLILMMSMKKKKTSSKMIKYTKMKSCLIMMTFMNLTFIGMKPVQQPYLKQSMISSMMYMLTLTSL